MTSTTEAKSTPAQKAHAAAVKASAAAADALGPAHDNVQAARDALAAAEAEAIEALTSKSADPKAARTRIETARAAIKTAEDNLNFAILQLRAAEVVEQQTIDDEVRAHRAVTGEEYLSENAKWNDPANRERALLTQLTDIIAELIPTIVARKALHSHLSQALSYFPDDEKRALAIPPGEGLTTYDTQRGAPVVQVPVPELADAIKDGVGRAGAAPGRA